MALLPEQGRFVTCLLLPTFNTIPAMRVEVDQSGKIEQTDRDTVVAFSDDRASSLRIPAQVKRDVIAVLRVRGKPRRPFHFIFAAAVFELLKPHLRQVDFITIDTEYRGREPAIKSKLLELIWLKNPEYPKDAIVFAQIGKKSLAHEKALATYRGEMNPGRVLTANRLLELLVGKKKDRGSPFATGP